MKEHKKLATVTVTYNRKELLLKNIRAVIAQDYDIDCIIIVDNHGTDNTEEAVMAEFPNNKIKYLYLEENTGGAGGFYTGCKYAYDNGYDWVLLMDDDGRPKNNDTIKNLMSIIENKELKASDKVILNSLILKDDFKLTFQLFLATDTIEDIKEKAEDRIILNRICPFNGTLVSRGLMEEIGFPDKNYFIINDEFDYCCRAKGANAYIATVTNSLYYHPSNCPDNVKEIDILGKKYFFSVSKPYKVYYATRNLIHTYKKNKKVIGRKYVAKCLIKTIISICIVKCEKIKTFKMLIKGYKDGKNGILGRTIEPY